MPLREPLRRFGAIGDIHCEDEALLATLDHLAGADLDAILAVGDIVDGTGDADRCCQLLREREVVTVRGNHERWLIAGDMRSLPDATLEVTDATLAFLGKLPATRELDTVRGKLLLCHGIGEDDMAVLEPDTRGYALQSVMMDVRLREDLKFVLGGHTHVRMVRTLGSLTFLNPGTLHRDYEPGFMIVDLERDVAEHWDVSRDGTTSLADAVELGGGS